MSEMRDEVAGPFEFDRRSLLKKGAAAGALGLAAPIAFDSFFSPAAACSGLTMVATKIHAGNWAGTTDSTASSPALSVTPISTSGKVFVAFNIRWKSSTAAPTPTFTSTNLSAFSSVGQIEYQTIGSPITDRLVLYLYRATPGTTTAQNLTVNFPSGNVNNFEGAVFQLTAPSAIWVGTAVTNSGSSNSASASVVTSSTKSAEVMVVGQNRNSGTGEQWTPPTGTTEIHDHATNDGSDDISIGAFFRTPVTSPLAIGNAGSAPWGAIAVEVDC